MTAELEKQNLLTDDEWRTCFIEYYATNVPEKMISDANPDAQLLHDTLMGKWEGRYEKLYAGMQKKYGLPGERKSQPKATKPIKKRGPVRRGPAKQPGGKKLTIGDCHDTFVEMVAEAAAHCADAATADRPETNLVDAKQGSAANGLETATFTVCSRIRPVHEREKGLGGDNFVCVIPGARATTTTTATTMETMDKQPKLHTEAALLLTPKISFRGDPELVSKSFTLDYVFSNETEQEIYETIGAPLVSRALQGRTGVMFAYGQTGSGKTHTMNNIMDRVAVQLFAEGASNKRVRFSYLELLGNKLSDGLLDNDEGTKATVKEVKMGEVDSGAVELHNLSEHAVTSAEQLLGLVEQAKSQRTVAATEKNDASSRSHGVAIFTISQGGEEGKEAHRPQDGKLYVIDLAGSESANDTQKHDKARMDETKKINISLNALKECINARTLASSPGSAHNTHIPFRRSRITLLLKDIFDVECPRLTATVVIATLNPLAKDAGQSNTTLGYAAPLREAVGMFGRNRKPKRKGKGKGKEALEKAVVLEVDVNDPALWSEQQLLVWLQGLQGLQLAADKLTGLTGLQLCLLPEPELFDRIGDADQASKVAKALWESIVAAKMVKRRPDGWILSDEAEAAEQKAEQAATEARMEAQAASAAAAVKADLAARGISDE